MKHTNIKIVDVFSVVRKPSGSWKIEGPCTYSKTWTDREDAENLAAFLNRVYTHAMKAGMNAAMIDGLTQE